VTILNYMKSTICVDSNESKLIGRFKCSWLSWNKVCNIDSHKFYVVVNVRKNIGEPNYLIIIPNKVLHIPSI